MKIFFVNAYRIFALFFWEGTQSGNNFFLVKVFPYLFHFFGVLLRLERCVWGNRYLLSGFRNFGRWAFSFPSPGLAFDFFLWGNDLYIEIGGSDIWIDWEFLPRSEIAPSVLVSWLNILFRWAHLAAIIVVGGCPFFCPDNFVDGFDLLVFGGFEFVEIGTCKGETA